MKLQGTILGQTVIILVDNGSTHNIISSTLVAELLLPTLEIPTFGVTIRNSDVITCNQVCPDVAIHLSGLMLKQDYFPTNLGSVDLVMGIS